MNFRKLLIGTLAVLSLAACSKSNDNKTSGGAAAATPALKDNNASTVDAYTAGTPNYTFSVAGGVLMVDGATISKIDSNTFAGYPMLASQVADLATMDKVIETKENSLELWASSSLLLAFDLRSGIPSLVHSRSGSFEIVSASWAMTAADKGQSQGLGSADLAINMKECIAEQKQDQGKTPAPIDQGKKFLAADVVGQGQGQGQGQDQGKPVELCKAVTMTFHLTEIAEQKQDQGKTPAPIDQGKTPAPIDQGKTPAPIDQGKTPAPIDQGKTPAPIDQGKTPAPIDQGKTPAPIDQGKTPAPIDQGKTPAPIDQGKTPAPIDQGKQTPAPAPVPAPIDQGKDQGKQTPAPAPVPAPIDQGKDQGQGKK